MHIDSNPTNTPHIYRQFDPPDFFRLNSYTGVNLKPLFGAAPGNIKQI